MARKKIYAANWKMHKTLDEVEAFVQEFSNYDVAGDGYEIVVFCPATGLGKLKELAKHFPGTYGAQNMYFETKGAFTGELSPLMVKDIGCEWILIGHSERRGIFGETDEMVHKKIIAAFENGLKPMVCCGETIEERKAGQLYDKVKGQVISALDKLTPEQVRGMAIAYEPIWAIGTGETATGEQANEMCAFIRKEVEKLYGADVAGDLPILYGGSVKPANIEELMGFADIDGGLIGGASLKPDSFRDIIVNGTK